MVDALQAGRSVRSFVELIHPGTDMVMFGDNRAALILAGGQGGGWRTRHLRIRSSALADALKRGELQLFHMAGTRLLADALTKLLHAVPLRRFCIGMGMVSPSSQMKALKSLDVKPVSSTGIKSKLGQCLGLLMSCLAFLPGVGGESTSDDEPSSMTLDWPLLLMLVAVIALWELLRAVGTWGVKWALGTKEDLKVKVLSHEAVLPARASCDAAGLDVSTVESFVLEPGERRLVSTGLQLELPPGTYGRLASRSGLASGFGVEVGAGVIDPDFRGEVKVLLFNQGHHNVTFNPGDRVAQLIVERFSCARVVPVNSLSTTIRSADGFGSTGVSTAAMAAVSRSSTSVTDGGLRLRSLRTSTEVGFSASSSAASSDTRSLSQPTHGSEPVSSDPFFPFCGSWFAGPGQPMETLIQARSDEFRRNLLPFDDWKFNIPPVSCADSRNEFLIDGEAISVFTHGKSRQKLFDVRVDSDFFRPVRVTLAWHCDGKVQLTVDRRNGYHSELLASKWRGYTIMYHKKA